MPSYDELGSARKMAIMIALVGSQGIQVHCYSSQFDTQF